MLNVTSRCQAASQESSESNEVQAYCMLAAVSQMPFKCSVQQAAHNAETNRQPRCPSLLNTNHRRAIKVQQCVDYRAPVCREQRTDLVDERVWWREIDGVPDRKRERESVSGCCSCCCCKSILLDFCCGHSSLDTIVLLGDWLQNFNKSSHADKHAICRVRLCESEVKNFSRSINCVVDGYITIAFKSLQL